jgi:hypothetical protein
MSDAKDSHTGPGASDRIDFEPSTETYSAHHDWERDGQVCLTVIEVVSTATGKRWNEMDPLFETIDAEALGKLLASGRESGLQTTFFYEGCSITISYTGKVTVTRLDG